VCVCVCVMCVCVFMVGVVLYRCENADCICECVDMCGRMMCVQSVSSACDLIVFYG